MTGRPPVGAVVRLGLAQTLAWASTYYLPAILAAPMARELGLPVPTVFAAFSLALIVSALVGPLAGAAIDRFGGRPVLMATSGLFALGLGLLATAQGLPGLLAGWTVLGIGMGSGLYEAGFAALVRLYGQRARAGITGITLFAGFASTVGWPLSAVLEHQLGWREACLAWAGLHLLLGLPLNAGLPRSAAAVPADTGTQTLAPTAAEPSTAAPTDPPAGPPARTAMAILAFVFAVTWFISTAMAAHLPRLLQAAGASAATALGVGMLIGPAQVGARLLEFGWLRRLHPLLSARLAAALHPLGVGLLLLGGPGFAALFGLLHGAGNGILTIAKGTLPLVLFGSSGYGARQGWLMVPARLAQAAAPFAFGVLLDRWQHAALWATAALGLAAAAALWGLRARAAADHAGLQP